MTPQAQEAAVTVALIEIGDRMRKPDVTVINGLADDMRDHGLLQRIGLRARFDGRFDLVWGRNRFEAAAKLGWTMIDAKVYPPNTPDELLKVLEIVENLRRQELTADERQSQTLLLAAAIKEAAPETVSSSRFVPGGRGRKGVAGQVAER